MSRCRNAHRAPAWLALAAVAALALGSLPARAQPVPPPAPAPAAPEDTEAKEAPQPPPPPRYLTADVVITELTDRGSKSRGFHLRRVDDRARIDPGEATDPRFTAETYYDYEKREFYRNLADDRIAFSYVIDPRDRVLAQIEGLMPVPADEPVYRLEVNPDAHFEGHPCTLVLAGFPTPQGRIHALHWVWEAQDLDGQAVKVVFPRGDGSIEIVEYRGASGAPFDPALVSVPAGRPVMSGF
jgi:hypothetical protein